MIAWSSSPNYRPGAAPVPEPSQVLPRLDVDALAPREFRDEATLLAATLEFHTEGLQDAVQTSRQACVAALEAARAPLQRARALFDTGDTVWHETEAAIAALGVTLDHEADGGLPCLIWCLTGLDGLATAFGVLGDVVLDVWERWLVRDPAVETSLTGWIVLRAS